MIIKKLSAEERQSRVKLAIEIISEAINNGTSMKVESEKRNLTKDYISHTFDLIEGMYRNEVTDELIHELENKYDEYYDRPIIVEGLAIPDRKKPLERMSKYKFNLLTAPGKCAVIPIKNGKQFSAICSYASNYAKSRGWKFTARQIDERRMGVWRVESKKLITEQ
jgi:hypothetical protein